MTADQHLDGPKQPRSRRRVWAALILVALLLILVIVPPYISINRYKGEITGLVSAALQRPVRFSGLELRLLPRPGFVIDDFTVQEDPQFGAEPVLHANTVDADIRLWSLWRGKLQISRISVDEASLNLVHTPDGRWNIEDLFHTAATQQQRAQGSAVPYPYMEATNSRINVNSGVEKLPFSLVNADASLWRESDGAWRVRLRGQPARTDVSLDLADTGTLRLEATLRPAANLADMPLHVDLDWRDAQLGQLSRLLLGSDEGWRGDLRGELHLDGTVESAKVASRLRATGVHRAEFAPAAPLDFDATCSFLFHSSVRTLNNLACDSPVGGGRVRLTGNVRPAGAPSDFGVALDQVPAQVGLDLLRTVRSDLDPELQAAGTVSGKLNYMPAGPSSGGVPDHAAKHKPQAASPLTGSVTIQGLKISGGALSRPIQIPKILFEPAPTGAASLAAAFSIPAGAPAPLGFTLGVSVHGFELGVHGPISLRLLHEFAHAAGFTQADLLSQISGEAAAVNMNAAGPWLPSILATELGNGSMSGALELKQAVWSPAFLARPVQLSSATLHFENGALNWDPVAFSFGSVKGTARLSLPAACEPGAQCPPQFAVHFATLDTAELQAALLGAPSKSTLLGSLLARFKSSSGVWPTLDGSIQADVLELGAFPLQSAEADVHIRPLGAEITSFGAGGYGGQFTGTADLTMNDKPAYKINGNFTGLHPAQVGKLFGMKWTGTSIGGTAHLEMSGYTQADLASSAVGTLRYTWVQGGMAPAGKSALPHAVVKFDRWTADAKIDGGDLVLGKNQVMRGTHASSVHGTVKFGAPAEVNFFTAAPAQTASR